MRQAVSVQWSPKLPPTDNNELEPNFTSIKMWPITSHSLCFVKINDEDGVSSPLWTIGFVHGQNLYEREAVAHASFTLHSRIQMSCNSASVCSQCCRKIAYITMMPSKSNFLRGQSSSRFIRRVYTQSLL